MHDSLSTIINAGHYSSEFAPISELKSPDAATSLFIHVCSEGWMVRAKDWVGIVMLLYLRSNGMNEHQ